MQRYFIYLRFDGTNYCGWQVQPNGISVQGELQKAISIILRCDIKVVGAGRTDAGVHARNMVAHFDYDAEFDCCQLAYKLNRLLPKDISVDRIVPVDNEMHARFSAVTRTYHYYIHLSKNPFLRHYSCELHYALDFDLMNEAAGHLLGFDDFGAFCKSHTDVKTTLCKITEAKWVNDSGDCWHFRITADRFLRNMVRAIVGTLIEVGRQRLSVSDFNKVVLSKNRCDAGESMPGNALFLENIVY